MMRESVLIAIYNMKGGVAKTTSALEFAYHLVQDGFKVLLVDADMQANLTTNIMMASVVPKDLIDSPGADEFEEKYDCRWKDIQKREVEDGVFQTFHKILEQCTGARVYLRKSGVDSIISKIKPLSAEGIDYIAGHMETAELEERISEGFRVPARYPVPALVTNVFREYANQNKYDFVIIDLGCTLTATVKSVLLGSDYIISPFKCERSCVTAAEIVMKKLRDWHTKSAADSVADILASTGAEGATPAAQADEISIELKGTPHFLGAFPVGVRVIDHRMRKIAQAYSLRIGEIFDRYETDIKRFHHATGLTRPNLELLRDLWVESSESSGLRAEGGGSVLTPSIPCMSLWYDKWKGLDFPRGSVFAGGVGQGFLTKAKRIKSEYQKILRALVYNMQEADKVYISGKSKGLFVGGAGSLDSESDEAPVDSEGAGKKRRRLGREVQGLMSAPEWNPDHFSSPAINRVRKMPALDTGSPFGFYHTAAPFKDATLVGGRLLKTMLDKWSGESDRVLKKVLKLSRESFKSSAGQQQFNAVAAASGFSLHDVPGDGNCFFHALLHQLQMRCPELPALADDLGYDHKALRARATEALLARDDLHDFIDNPDALLAKVSADREWADDFVISTLARALRITIVLINSDGNQPTIIAGGEDATVYLGYQVGIHFQSLDGDPSAALSAMVAAKHASGAAPAPM